MVHMLNSGMANNLKNQVLFIIVIIFILLFVPRYDTLHVHSVSLNASHRNVGIPQPRYCVLWLRYFSQCLRMAESKYIAFMNVSNATSFSCNIHESNNIPYIPIIVSYMA